MKTENRAVVELTVHGRTSTNSMTGGNHRHSSAEMLDRVGEVERLGRGTWGHVGKVDAGHVHLLDVLSMRSGLNDEDFELGVGGSQPGSGDAGSKPTYRLIEAVRVASR